MRFGSVCSGIEAASVAWEPLGWGADWFAEIEKFPAAVLAHHWPDVPNVGNMLRLPEMVANDNLPAPDVLVGGTPCQAFSVAGKRGSLEDERGALTLAYVELLNEIDHRRVANGLRPAIAVWENVPGVLSTKDNAFGCFLGGLAGEDRPLFPTGARWSNAGAVFGPARAVAWRILDAQYFGVAQRRRRVFVVASARNEFDPCAVLFEFDGLRRDTPPRREAGQGAAADVGSGAAGSHWDALTNPHPSLNQSHNTGGIGASNQEIFSQRGAGLTWPAEIASTLNAAFGSKLGLEDQHINGGAPLFAPAALNDNAPQAVAFAENSRAEVRLEGGDGTRTGALSTGGGKAGQGVPMVACAVGGNIAQAIRPDTWFRCGDCGDVYQDRHAQSLNDWCPAECPRCGDEDRQEFATPQAVSVCGNIAHTLKAEGFDASEDGTGRGVPTIAFHPTQDPISSAEAAHAVGCGSSSGQASVAVTVALRGRDGGATAELGGEVATALRASTGGGDKPHVLTPMAVRRLTPTECERLQGFPDDHTLVPHRGKPAADGPRYKALGNSMAVPVMRWIGERIDAQLRALHEQVGGK